MTTKADIALERVHSLYILQIKLLDLLSGNLRNPNVRREARSSMKEFEKLLSKADWRYMGGQDVFESLQRLPTEISSRLRLTLSRPAKRTGKKIVSRKPAKVHQKTKSRTVRIKRK